MRVKFPEQQPERSSSWIVFIPLLIVVGVAAYFLVTKHTDIPAMLSQLTSRSTPAPAAESTPTPQPPSQTVVPSQPTALSTIPTVIPAPTGLAREEQIQSIVLVVYDRDRGMVFRQIEGALPVTTTESALHLLNLLKKSSIIPAEIIFRDVIALPDNELLVDYQYESRQASREGILEEAAMIASMVLTVTQNLPDVKALRFTLDGKQTNTVNGHITLSKTFTPELAKSMVENRPIAM